MIEDDGEICMFAILGDKSNDLHVVDRLSIVTSGRLRPLPILIFERLFRLFKHLKSRFSSDRMTL